MSLDDLRLRDHTPVPALRRPLTHVPHPATPTSTSTWARGWTSWADALEPPAG